MVLIFDDQRCFLQTGFNNLFDLVAFISNEERHLFDVWVFQGLLLNRLDFSCNCRECWPNGIK